MQYTSQKSPSYFDKYQERESTPPRQGSHNAKHHINPDRKPTYDSINKEYERPTTERLRSQQESNPPVSRRRVSSINIGLNVSPPSSDSSHGHKHTVNGGLSGYNGPGKRGSNGYATSPPTLRSERTNPRKREFDHRESSEEHEHERRRQADDITPKLKRRQPKVAEAYRSAIFVIFLVSMTDFTVKSAMVSLSERSAKAVPQARSDFLYHKSSHYIRIPKPRVYVR